MEKNIKSKRKSRISLILRVAIAAAASWIILKDLDYVHLAEAFRRLHPPVLLLAIAVYWLGQSLVGFRWWMVLRAQQIRVPLIMAEKLTFIGYFFSQFMPSSVGGDLVRAWYIAQHSHKKLQAALGVAVDRMVGLTSTFLLAFGSYFLFMRGEHILEISQQTASGRLSWIHADHLIPLLLSAGLVLAGLLLVLSAFRAFRILCIRSYGHVVHFLVQFTEVVKVYYHHPWIFFAGLAITIFLQGLIILSFWGLGRDLEMDAAIQYYFVFFPMVWAFGSIPISIAGIGIMEGGLVFLFVKFTGCNPEAAIALALCQRLTWLTAAVPGMWFHLRGTHRKIPT